MTQLKTLLAVGGAALAIAALPAPAFAQSGQGAGQGASGGYSSGGVYHPTGGTDVPAPAAFALFGIGAGILAAKRRRTRA